MYPLSIYGAPPRTPLVSMALLPIPLSIYMALLPYPYSIYGALIHPCAPFSIYGAPPYTPFVSMEHSSLCPP